MSFPKIELSDEDIRYASYDYVNDSMTVELWDDYELNFTEQDIKDLLYCLRHHRAGRDGGAHEGSRI